MRYWVLSFICAVGFAGNIFLVTLKKAPSKIDEYPAPEPLAQPYTVGPSVYATVEDFLDVMGESGHYTSWQTGTITNDKGEESGKLFMFVTFNKKRAEQAESVMRKAGLLCTTPLGRKLVDADGKVTKIPWNTWRGAPWEDTK